MPYDDEIGDSSFVMLGSIIGDIIGSAYEFHNVKTKDFTLFPPAACFTDDTILTCAVADWLVHGGDPARYLRTWGQAYRHRTYENGTVAAFGRGFSAWLNGENTVPSVMNGCVMRLSPLLALKTCADAKRKADVLTRLTHNTPEALTAVRAYIETGFLLKHRVPVARIIRMIGPKYGYDLSQTPDDIRPTYNRFYCRCSRSVPQAMICALTAKSYEDAIRAAVSLGGDSDTLAAMAGGLAAVRFSIPDSLLRQADTRLDTRTRAMVRTFLRWQKDQGRVYATYAVQGQDRS